MAGDETNSCPFIPYEIVESTHNIYITALLPTAIRYLPYVDIRRDSVKICVEPWEVIISLPHPINVSHSFYDIRHRTLDIVMAKEQPKNEL